MKVTIDSKNIEIVPKAFEGETPRPTFVFRQLNCRDVLNAQREIPTYIDGNGVERYDLMQFGLDFLDTLFIEAKNLEFYDKDENIIELKKFSQIFDITADSRFTAAYNEIFGEIETIVKRAREQGDKTIKKCQSAGKSSKQAKKK